MLKNTSTLFTPLNHSGSETQQNPDSVKQVNKFELPKRLILFIPNNFNIDQLVEDYPPDFPYHRDHFVYLVHLITDIPSRKKDADMEFVPLYSALVQRRIRNYRKCLNYLVQHCVLIENRQYVVSKKSRSFKFAIGYETPIVETNITKATLIKSILKFITLDNGQIVAEIDSNKPQELSYLLKWFNQNLTIDYEAAENYLSKLYEEDIKNYNFFTSDKPCDAMTKLNRRRIAVLKLRRQEFNYTIDRTAGRLHTVLCQLKTELRQFVKYDNSTLVAIDITNSQPYLSTTLFDFEKFKKNNILHIIQQYNNTFLQYHTYNPQPYYLSKNVQNAQTSENVKQYIHLVQSGQLYEEFGKILLERNLINNDRPIRKQAKEIIFSSIFSPNSSISYNKEMQIFKEYFPDVYEIYRCIKQNEHRTLPCLLQNLEAKLVLHETCKIISNERPDIPILTLHDSIITTRGNEDYVYSILFNVLQNAIGIPPTLKFESWEEVA